MKMVHGLCFCMFAVAALAVIPARGGYYQEGGRRFYGPDRVSSADGVYLKFDRRVICHQVDRSVRTNGYYLPVADGGSVEIEETDSKGNTDWKFSFRDQSGRMTSIKRRTRDDHDEFVVNGHKCRFYADWYPFGVWLEVDAVYDEGGNLAEGIFIYYEIDENGVGGGAASGVPEEWKKARTLTGIATRAVSYMGGCFGTSTVKCSKADKKGGAVVSLVITPFSGKKMTYRSQKVNVMRSPVKVVWPDFSLAIDGESFSGGTGLDGGISVSTAEIGGDVRGVAMFDMSGTPAVIGKDAVIYPNHGAGWSVEKFSANGRAWSFARATKMVWDGAEWIMDSAGGKTNISKLKLSYNPKTGLFKGKYTLYAQAGRKYQASVSGLIVNGRGYGEATIKKPYTAWDVGIGFSFSD